VFRNFKKVKKLTLQRFRKTALKVGQGLKAEATCPYAPLETARTSERNFTRGYWRPIPGPPSFWSPRQNLYSLFV